MVRTAAPRCDRTIAPYQPTLHLSDDTQRIPDQSRRAFHVKHGCGCGVLITSNSSESTVRIRHSSRRTLHVPTWMGEWSATIGVYLQAGLVGGAFYPRQLTPFCTIASSRYGLANANEPCATSYSRRTPSAPLANPRRLQMGYLPLSHAAGMGRFT